MFYLLKSLSGAEYVEKNIFSRSFKKILTRAWTSLYMDGTASKFFLVICPHEAGTWDPNYAPGVDFLDHNFLSSKNSG